MTDRERWLQINTFYCSALRCRLTPEQCEANRARPRLYKGGGWLDNRPVMPGPCEKCTEWKTLCEEVYQRRKEEAMGKVGVCKNCGEERYIKARGLCSKCYQKLKEEGKLPVEKPGPKKALRVVVDFGVCPVLYEQLVEKANEEMRPLATQIVWELKKAFGLMKGSEKVGGTV